MTLALIAVGPASAQESWPPTELTEGRIAYAIASQDASDLLAEFAANAGPSIVVDGRIDRAVRSLSGEMSPAEFLDAVTGRIGADWYHDGSTVHVTPSSARRTVVVAFDTFDEATLEGVMADLGVADPRFPVRSSHDGALGVITGPPRMVELAENAFALIAAAPPREAGAPARSGTGDAVPGGAVPMPRAEPGQEVEAPGPDTVLIMRGGASEIWRDPMPAERPVPRTAPGGARLYAIGTETAPDES